MKMTPSPKVITLVKVLRIGCLLGEIVSVFALVALVVVIPFSETIVSKGGHLDIYTGINRSLNFGFNVSVGDRSEKADPLVYPGSMTFGPFRLLGGAREKTPFVTNGGVEADVLLENIEGTLVFRKATDAIQVLSVVKWPIVMAVLCADLIGLAILELFRRLLLSAERADVFTKENIRYVRLVGILMIASSLVKLVTAGMLVHRMASFVTRHLAIGTPNLGTSVDGNLSGVVTGLMILTLAEVFRHRIALKEDSSLTI